MDDLYLRPLTTQDMTFFMNELEEGGRMGSFSIEYSKAGGNKILEKQIREVIRKNEAEENSGHLIYILTRHTNNQKIGYIWFMTAPDLYYQTRLEIRAIGVTKAFRGKGYASMMLAGCIEKNGRYPMQAKCYAKSKRMADMLLRRGFTIDQTLPSGSVFLIRDPR